MPAEDNVHALRRKNGSPGTAAGEPIRPSTFFPGRAMGDTPPCDLVPLLQSASTTPLWVEREGVCRRAWWVRIS